MTRAERITLKMVASSRPQSPVQKPTQAKRCTHYREGETYSGKSAALQKKAVDTASMTI